MTLGQELANIKEERPQPYTTVFLHVSIHSMNEMDKWCNSNLGLQGPTWNHICAYVHAAYVDNHHNAVYYFDTAEHKFQFDLVWPN